MQVVGAARQGFAFKPLLPLFRDAIPIAVGELPDARRRRNINRTVKPEHALGKHQLLSKDRTLIISPVAIAVLQAHDAMGLVFELFLDFLIRARGIRHIQAALLVQIRRNRPVDQRRAGDQLDFKAIRHGQSLGGKFELSG